MPKGLITILMLVVSNVFMTFAWYGNLKLQQMNIIKDWPLIAIIALSWGMAFFEYSFMIPANRIGAKTMTLDQLKIMQEAISLMVFIPFSVLFMKNAFNWNYLAAAICILLAVFFVFRAPAGG